MTDRNHAADSPNRAFINGRVITMDADETITEAVLVRGGRIEAVGTSATIQAGLNDGDEVVDLAGRTLLPGFIDAHGHFPGSGIIEVGVDLYSPPIGRITRLRQVIEAIKAKAAVTEKGRWILGWGYDDTLLDEKRMLEREELDEASTDHPIYVSHVSGHMGSANSAALELAGYRTGTPDPEGGVIRRDPTSGELYGVVEEAAAFHLSALATAFTPEEQHKMLQSAVAEYARYGVTTAQCGLCNERYLTGLAEASRLGQIPLRIIAWPDIALGDKILAGQFDVERHNSVRFQVGAVKIIGDGSIQAYTAHLSKPYHVPFQGNTEYRGYPVTHRDELVSLVKRFHQAGLQIAIHGNGDATIDDIIYAVRAAQQTLPRQDPRHIIIHCQTVRDDQLEVMKPLGLTPSFFSAHAYFWGERHRAVFLGPKRADRLNPAASALRKGLRISLHLDTPVTPMRPLLLAWSAINRISTAGNVIGEAERITPLQALRAITIDAAWQVFQEQNRGSIEIGKLADLVILDRDPIDHPDTIKDIRVQETIIGGQTVFKA
jgi:predicted amidohydrolase YtcJ